MFGGMKYKSIVLYTMYALGILLMKQQNKRNKNMANIIKINAICKGINLNAESLDRYTSEFIKKINVETDGIPEFVKKMAVIACGISGGEPLIDNEMIIPPWEYVITDNQIKISFDDVSIPIPPIINLKKFNEQKPFIRIFNRQNKLIVEIPIEE